MNSSILPASCRQAARSLPQLFYADARLFPSCVVVSLGCLRDKTLPHITTKPSSQRTPDRYSTDRAHSRRLSDFGYDVILQVTTMPGLKN